MIIMDCNVVHENGLVGRALTLDRVIIENNKTICEVSVHLDRNHIEKDKLFSKRVQFDRNNADFLGELSLELQTNDELNM